MHLYHKGLHNRFMAQWWNPQALLYFPYVRFLRSELAIPHFCVADIRSVSPQKLQGHGFRGVIFDKDNTITAPYVNEIYATIADAFAAFQDTYGKRIVIMSNSAGTKDDWDHEDAKKIEDDLCITVLRHDRKKPGGIEAALDYFDCKPSQLVMIGDRIFTDIVFGNRYGMLTIHTALLTEEGDLGAAVKARRYELALLERWKKQGKKAPAHPLYHEDICSIQLLS
ncbi:YqeG family HAD IIIA-type phosphatase [Candidatus Woesearchaeota archaeon]|nr:YqeG family HAD IIIA-type phosphatase [Candidatus Woesearchaeota archaeon]